MEQIAFAVKRGRSPIECSTDKLVPWWSITKSVLAAAALRLVDQGTLRLDENYKDRQYTTRQLLQHTAGVRNYGGEIYQSAVAAGGPAWTVDELLSRVGAEKLMFSPGSGWSYSNVGYLFVRQLIEETLDTDIESALKLLVFDPMELRTPRIATNQSDLLDSLWDDLALYDPNWVYHGLLLGSPSDAVSFLDKLLTSSFLSRGALEDMLSTQRIGGAVPGRPWTRSGYGLGLMIGEMTGVGHSIGHSGVGFDTVSALYQFPNLATPATVATFANAADEGLTEFEAIRLATIP